MKPNFRLIWSDATLFWIFTASSWEHGCRVNHFLALRKGEADIWSMTEDSSWLIPRRFLGWAPPSWVCACVTSGSMLFRDAPLLFLLKPRSHHPMAPRSHQSIKPHRQSAPRSHHPITLTRRKKENHSCLMRTFPVYHQTRPSKSRRKLFRTNQPWGSQPNNQLIRRQTSASTTSAFCSAQGLLLVGLKFSRLKF